MENIIYNSLAFIIEFIKLYLATGFFVKLNDVNKKIKYSVFASVSAAVGIVSLWINLSEFDIIFGIISIILIFFILTDKKKIAVVAFMYVCICIIDMLLSAVVVWITPFTYDYLYAHSGLTLALNSIQVFIISIVMLIKKYDFKNNTLEDMSLGYLAMFVIGGVTLSIYITYLQLLPSENHSRQYNIIFFSINITSAVYVIVCLMLFMNRCRNKQLRRELDTIKKCMRLKEEYYQVLSEKDEEIKKFRHDIRNHLFCMYTLLQDKEYTELDDYFSDIISNLKEASLSFNTGNKLINAILNDLTNRFNSVTLSCSGTMPADIGISSIDICTIFSNLLSNAFEAAEKSEVSTVDIHIGIVNQSLSFTIKNTSDNAPRKKGANFVTSKKSGPHGYGIANASRCIEKNNGIVRFDYKDGYFNSKILLFNIIQD